MSEQKLRNHSTHKKMTKTYAGRCTAVLDSTPPNAGKKKKENILKIRIYKVEEEESKMRKRRKKEGTPFLCPHSFRIKLNGRTQMGLDFLNLLYSTDPNLDAAQRAREEE